MIVRAFLTLHILGGTLALASGYGALFARKGSGLHRGAGTLFVYAMLAMGLGATVVGLAHDKATWLGGPMVMYFVITGMRTVHRAVGPGLAVDGGLLLVAVAVGTLSLAGGLQGLAGTDARLQGPPAVASVVNAMLLFTAAVGDARVLRHGPLTGNQRLARHLWRMCFAMFAASGSFFLGQAEVIPVPLRNGPVLAVLALLPLGFLLFFRWKVRDRAGLRQARKPILAAVLLLSVLSPDIMRAQSTPGASAAYDLGRIAIAEGDDEAAVRHFERAAELDDLNPDHHYWLGRALYGATSRASKLVVPAMAHRVKRSWERAVALDSNHIDARVGLAEFYAMAPRFMGGGERKARQQVAAVTQLDPLRGLLSRAEVARYLGDHGEEERALTQAIAAFPDTAAPYVALADAYMRSQRHDDAFDVVQRYAKRAPADAWARYYAGRLAGSSGQRLADGTAALHEFLAAPPPGLSDPDRARVHYWLGRIAERRGDRDVARAEYRRASDVNPRSRVIRQALEALK